MPALLAPCTRGIISQEKLSPPLAGSQRADVLDLQGPGHWGYSSRGHRGVKSRQLVTAKTTKVKIIPKAKAVRSLPNKTKLKVKKGSVVQQTKLKIKGKYQKKKQKAFKHEIDFEPPCKRTRLAASLTGNHKETSRKVCKCARLNAPSRLTCFGQRCPCYSKRLPCISCMCRGCRNPQKQPALLRNGDDDRSDVEHDPPMPRLSPEPRMWNLSVLVHSQPLVILLLLLLFYLFWGADSLLFSLYIFKWLHCNGCNGLYCFYGKVVCGGCCYCYLVFVDYYFLFFSPLPFWDIWI